MIKHRGAATICVAIATATSLAVGTTRGSVVDAEASEATPGSPRGASQVLSSGGRHSCAVLTDGSVKCWGRGANGQLGQNADDNIGDGVGPPAAAVAPIDFGGGATATSVSAGGNHSCAILTGGSVRCWGRGSQGRLGTNAAVDVGDGVGPTVAATPNIDLGSGRTAVEIGAGDGHTCAILDDGSVKCWGRNGTGQLGQGDTTNVGDGVGPSVADIDPVDLGTGRTATAIAVANLHTCAILDEGSVKCWGANDGRLGNDDTEPVGTAPGEMGDALAAIDFGQGRSARAISALNNHTCAILIDDSIVCWGRNAWGQLGQNSVDVIGDGVGPSVRDVTGVDFGVQRTPIAISTGGTSSCALFDDGHVRCWGRGSIGQLGSDDTANVGNGTGVAVSAHPDVVLAPGLAASALSVGSSHACVLVQTGVTCWGNGGNGRLGQNSVDNIGDGLGNSVAATNSIDFGPGTSVAAQPAPPPPPTSVAAAAGLGSAQVTWTAPADSGGAPIARYRVQRSGDGITWVTDGETGPTSTSYSTPSTPGQPVWFRVLALNAAGSGVPSAPTAPVTPYDAYVPVNPARLLDTRPGGQTIDGLSTPGAKLIGGEEIELQIAGRGGAPGTVSAVALNVTVNEPEQAGFVTAYPCNTPRPDASNLNYVTDQTIPNSVIVKVGAAGTVCLYADQTTHLIADIGATL